MRYPNGKPISVPNIKDLRKMLNLIPLDAKHFHKSFFPNKNVENDIEGFNGNLNFEIKLEY